MGFYTDKSKFAKSTTIGIYRRLKHFKDIETARSKDWAEVPAIVEETPSVEVIKYPAYVGSGTIQHSEDLVKPGTLCCWYSGRICEKKLSYPKQYRLNKGDEINVIIDKFSGEKLFIIDKF